MTWEGDRVVPPEQAFSTWEIFFCLMFASHGRRWDPSLTLSRIVSKSCKISSSRWASQSLLWRSSEKTYSHQTCKSHSFSDQCDSHTSSDRYKSASDKLTGRASVFWEPGIWRTHLICKRHRTCDQFNVTLYISFHNMKLVLCIKRHSAPLQQEELRCCK